MAIILADDLLKFLQQPGAALTLISTVLVIFITAKAWCKSSRKNNDTKSPPSPWALPIIGNMHQLLSANPHRSLASLASQYGPLITVRLGCARYLVFSSAMAASEAMRANDLAFSSRPYLASSDRLFYGPSDIALTPYGERWRQARRVCVTHLLSTVRLQQWRHVREEEVGGLLDKIAGRAKGSPQGLVNVSTELLELTSNVITRAALGRSHWSEEDRTASAEGGGARTLFSELGEMVGKPNIADFFPWLAWINRINGFETRAAKLVKDLDELLEQEIKYQVHMRQASSTGNEDRGDDKVVDANFVAMLLSVEKTAEYPLVDRDTIKAIILDMFAAGTHTTLAVMDWAMTELMRHPQVRAKLTQEIRSTCTKELVTEEDVDGMPYLRCVIKEVLRMYPALPLLIPRETIQETDVIGYHVPKGTKVLINSWAIHRDPNIWNNPDEFRPERFAGSAVDFKGFDFELIPFGSGRRGCPGMLFASLLIHLAVANLLFRFDFDLPEGTTAADLDASEADGITTSRKYSLLVKVRPAGT